MASIEGRRGMPRTRPPFPAVSGLWGKPTNINNVETCANMPWIVSNGAEAYAALGTEKSRGTKAFSLAGKIVNGGLAEVPMGSTLRHVIFDVGGGIKDGREFKAVQLGGPSGGCVPASLLDTPVDYESLAATGAIIGSGGMVVMDETTCMVDLARYFLQFTQNESCGKCVPCRLGTKRMLEILERITSGEGEEGDIERLEKLAHDHQADEPLRPRPDGAQPRAHHAQVLPRRVRGAHPRAALPGAGLQAAHHVLPSTPRPAPAARSAPRSARPTASPARRSRRTSIDERVRDLHISRCDARAVARLPRDRLPSSSRCSGRRWQIAAAVADAARRS